MPQLLKMKTHPAEDFMELLELCYQQVRADPSSVTENPHLYELQHKIYLRLCHGDIEQAEAERE
jgi:hypothetical protein